MFAGTVAAAADLAFRLVGGQIKEVQRAARATERTERVSTAPPRRASALPSALPYRGHTHHQP